MSDHSPVDEREEEQREALPISDDSHLDASTHHPSGVTGRVVFVVVLALVGATLGIIFLPRALDSLSELITQLVNSIANREDNAPPRAVQVPYTAYWFVYPAMGLLGLILGAGVGNLLNRMGSSVAAKWETMAIGDKVDLFLGIFAGIVLSFPSYVLFQSLGQVITPVITLALLVGFAAMSVYVLKSIREVLPWHKKAAVAARRSGLKVLDTNVLIDGRLNDIVRAGFLEGDLYVPEFVLAELQKIADASDSLKRQRGRRGLEVLRQLRSDFKVIVGVHDRHAPDEREPVDARLVRLARAVGGDLVSNDFNLNKVARIQDVRVLNINDLALALRATLLPGEPIELHLIREGSQYGQAVGYLEDGTMVVVEGGRPYIGEVADVVVTQVIQTERGKMIFASVDGLDPIQAAATRKPRR